MGILERKERLTENNIIVGSSLIYNMNNQEGILDEDFYQFRWKIETVGNIFNELLRKNNLNKNSNEKINRLIFKDSLEKRNQQDQEIITKTKYMKLIKNF